MSLIGLITALATPFAASGAIDLKSWDQMLRVQRVSGVNGVVVAGSTGEAAMLSDSEFHQLMRTAKTTLGPDIPIIAGAGASGTDKTVEQVHNVHRAGAAVALVVTPPYVRPNQEGLIAHYMQVASSSAIPIMLYNVPPRSGCDILPETVEKLRTHSNICGIKESCPGPERMRALLCLQTPNFRVFSGDDATASRALHAGASGWISVASNVAPAAHALLCRLARANDPAAVRWNERLRQLHDFCSVEPNPIPVKALLRALGFGYGVRLPLVSLSSAYESDVQKLCQLVRSVEEDARAQM